MLRHLRLLASKLRNTPLHPQWFAFLRERRYLDLECAAFSGTVLDVGCMDSRPRDFMPDCVTYYGLDYLDTASDWYGTRPDVYGDAQKLPVADAVLDHVLLLDVLEHLPDPDACIAELHRSLKPGGTLVLQVPFMYPVHDAPLDFHRWTRDALAAAAARHGFSVSREVALGHPLETAALISNIALSATVLRWIRQPNPLAIVIVLLPFIVLARNTAAWLMASISPADGLMPYAYRMTWTKG